MARTETVFSVFLASPNDVAGERDRIEDAISDWNRNWGKNLNLRLEVIRWEQDAYPGMAKDAQDVINQQIPDAYDLFVGIMWSRFGTPTGRAGSGTAEEFERAIAKRKEYPDDLEIFFYFKDMPIPPSKVEPMQLQKVQEFKNSLGPRGVLWWGFADTDQFEKLFAMHITKYVQNWKQKQHKPQPDESSTRLAASLSDQNISSPQLHDKEQNNDDGFLDFLEVFEERIGEVNAIALRLTEAQNELAVRTAQGASDLQKLAATPQGTAPAQARRLIARVADEMFQFTNRVNAEVPLFRSAIDSSLNALTSAATLSADFDNEQSHSVAPAIAGLLAALVGARQSMVEFRESTLALPRITKELNVAKRKQAAALESLITEFENAEHLLAEALTVIEPLLGNSQQQNNAPTDLKILESDPSIR
jgi:hypothetical protein